MRWGDPALTPWILGGYLALLTSAWGLMTAAVAGWHRRYALPDVPSPRALPRLTVCIPARDEAACIGACVRAALAQDHPDLEVIVVDDQSSDGTAAIAEAAGAGDPRLRVVRNDPPAAGWAGKPWACRRAATEATGEDLLFVDADVVLSPEAARRAAQVLHARGLGMVSLFGTWELVGWWERVAIPVIGWFIRGATDPARVNDDARPEAFANGQFILVTRAAYDSVGGHGAVAGEVLEDVRLGRALKHAGHTLGLHAAPWAFRVRLYRSLGEIVAGYGKNLYEGMDRRPSVALGAIGFLAIGAFVPWLLLAGALATPDWFLAGLGARGAWTAWIALTCAAPLAFRWVVERRDGRSGAMAWTHPIGNLVLAWVLLRAFLGVRTRWKGRTFVDGKAAPVTR
jgi:glycosyltransferase involved in cell wall biosynthesis